MIRELLESSQKIAIFWHESIDWDSLWAMLWLGNLLEKFWKKVRYFTPSKPSDIFNFLPWIKKIKTQFDYWKYDILIFTDFTWYWRIDRFTRGKEDYFNKNKLIIIDHHPENHIAKHALKIKDTNRISTCEIIFQYTYKRRKKLYDKNIATYLYLWISTDSWNFRYDEWKQSEKLFDTALKLIKLWADKKQITEKIFRSKNINSIKFMQLLLSRIKSDGDILYTYYDEKELKKYKIDEEQWVYAQIIMQDIVWPEIIILFKKIWDYIKWSIRSKEIDVSKIAQSLWWWWHKKASWFKVEFKSDFNKQIKEILAKIRELSKK